MVRTRLLLLLSVVALLTPTASNAQTTIFSDDFEGVSPPTPGAVLPDQSKWDTSIAIPATCCDAVGVELDANGNGFGVGGSQGMFIKRVDAEPRVGQAKAPFTAITGGIVEVSLSYTEFAPNPVILGFHFNGDGENPPLLESQTSNVETGGDTPVLQWNDFNPNVHTPFVAAEGGGFLEYNGGGGQGIFNDVKYTIDLDNDTVVAELNGVVSNPISVDFGANGLENFLIRGAGDGQASLVDNVNIVSLAPEADRVFWKEDRSGDWSVLDNWGPVTPGELQVVPNGNTKQAVFGDVVNAPRTVFSDAPMTVNGIEFDNINKYVVGGQGSINLQASTQGDPYIRVTEGSHEFQLRVGLDDDTTVEVSSGAQLEFVNRLNLGGKTLTKSGDGTLLVTNQLNTGGGTILNNGGVLAGGGIIGGDVNNDGGIISPGNSASGASQVVPEPSSICLLVCAAGGLLAALRRRREFPLVLLSVLAMAWLGSDHTANGLTIQHNGSAVFSDDFESYMDFRPDPAPSPQTGAIGDWELYSNNHFEGDVLWVETSGGAVPPAVEGTGYLLVTGFDSPGGYSVAGEAWLDVGDITSGTLRVEMALYDSVGSRGLGSFVRWQDDTPSEAEGGWPSALRSNDGNLEHGVLDGDGWMDTGLDLRTDAWNTLIYEFNLNSATASVTLNGETVSGLPALQIPVVGNLVFRGDIDSVMGVDAIPPDADQVFWKEDHSGDWSVLDNWGPVNQGELPVVPNGNNKRAVFGDVVNAPRTVFNDTPVTVNGIEFDNSNSYAVVGPGSINLQAGTLGDPQIHVTQGSHEFQLRVGLDADTSVDVASGAQLEFVNRLNLDGNTLTKSGDGTLLVTNQLNSGGGTIINSAGVLGGGGTIGGNVQNLSGILSPGNSAGNAVASSTMSIPEPGSSVLLGWAVGMLAARVRWRRRGQVGG